MGISSNRCKPNLARLGLAVSALLLGMEMSPCLAAMVYPENCQSDNAQPCIQRAIARASEQGDNVRIPSGSWRLATPIVLASGVSIFGTEDETILFPTPSNDGPAVLVYGHDVKNVLVSRITFDGGGSELANPADVIDVDGGRYVVFDHITVQNSRGRGIHFETKVGVTMYSGVQFSRFVNIGNHWRTTHNRDDCKTGIRFIGDDQAVPSLYKTRRNFVYSSTFTDIGNDAVEGTNQYEFFVVNNRFNISSELRAKVKAWEYSAGIYMQNVNHALISRNIIDGARGNGIDMPAVRNAIVEYNVVRNSGQAGMGVFRGENYPIDARNILIDHNIITDSGQWKVSTWWRSGIAIGLGNPTDITINGNTITDTRKKGKKTQAYGIEVVTTDNIKTHPINLTVSNDNKLSGNAKGSTHGL